MLDLDKAMSVLRKEFSEELGALPSHMSDARTASMLVWVLAYDTEDYYSLPIYWHKAVGTLVTGLRLLRATENMGGWSNSRSHEVDEFCIAFLEHLWSKQDRGELVFATQYCWSTCNFDFGMCYDFIWTVWAGLCEEVDNLD